MLLNDVLIYRSLPKRAREEIGRMVERAHLFASGRGRDVETWERDRKDWRPKVWLRLVGTSDTLTRGSFEKEEVNA